MSDQYGAEWQRLKGIADDVRTLQRKVMELEDHASRIRSELANLPYETDEEGNDIYESTRNALYSQLSSVESLIREAEYQERELASYAGSLGASYRQQAADYTYKASQAGGAASDFQKLSGYRFGASTAAAGANLANQRRTHYDDHANILNSLAAAADQAASGIAPSATPQTVSDRGTFQNPGTSSGYTSSVSRTGTGSGVGSSVRQLWSGAQGNSVKKAQDEVVSATVSRLGSAGIPYQNGTPDFTPVSHAGVSTAAMSVAAGAAGVGVIALADAMLAKKLGITAEEAAQYRKDNNLEWRADGTGEQANLIPQGISEEYSEGKQAVKEPTPMEALTAYMCAHNYGIDDYATYSQDPEWVKLHRAVFPAYHQVVDREMSKEEKVEWIRQVVPGTGSEEAKSIVKAMEHYSGNGYGNIHWDENGSMHETKEILKVFDSGKVPAYIGVIHRGLSFASEKELVRRLKRAKHEGWIWTEPGITSFSTDMVIAEEEFAKKGDWGLVLTCESNKSAIPFRHMSVNDWEKEVLSPGGHRNRGWKIDPSSYRKDKNNKIIYLTMKEL